MKLAAAQRWLERNALFLGLGISGALLLGLCVQEALLDRFELMQRDPVVLMLLRIAMVHCLQVAYFPAAYYALLGGTRDTVRELEEVLEPDDETWDAGSAVRVRKSTLLIMCAIGLVAAIGMPFMTDDTPWNPSTWPPELWWHRILGIVSAVWTGFFFAAVWDTATQVSRLADWIQTVDLLDLGVWSPFVKQALLTVLLVVGGLSVQALRLYEPGERVVLAITFGACLPLAILGLWLPVRGANRRISQAKDVEIARIYERIQASRAALLDDAADDSAGSLGGNLPDQMSGLVAYLRLIESVPEWPFQPSTLAQAALYLLIPIASWVGSALVESLLGRLIG
jgi:hypothetical protein